MLKWLAIRINVKVTPLCESSESPRWDICRGGLWSSGSLHRSSTSPQFHPHLELQQIQRIDGDLQFWQPEPSPAEPVGWQSWSGHGSGSFGQRLPSSAEPGQFNTLRLLYLHFLWFPDEASSPNPCQYYRPHHWYDFLCVCEWLEKDHFFWGLKCQYVVLYFCSDDDEYDCRRSWWGTAVSVFIFLITVSVALSRCFRLRGK